MLARKILIVGCAVMLTQCKDHIFKFQAVPRFIDSTVATQPPAVVPPPPPGLVTLEIGCVSGLNQTLKVGPSLDSQQRVESNAEISVNLKGKFCPTAAEPQGLTILFITDYSGSMGPNVDRAGGTSGNDPRIGNNCARLQAAEALLASLQDNGKVTVGNVAFASGIIESHSSAPVPMNVFRSTMLGPDNKVQKFCSYVAPTPSLANNEMAIKNINVGAGTDYEIAFLKALEYLRNIQGRKAIYFITDGKPTESSGANPLADGKRVLAQLKTLPDLQISAFFLQRPQPGSTIDTQGFGQLIETMGGPERVVKAESAAQLAAEIIKVPIATFEPTTLELLLTTQQKPSEAIKIQSFQLDPVSKKDWIFETQPFALTGNGSKTLPHMIHIKAKDNKGTSHSGQFQILYQKSL